MFLSLFNKILSPRSTNIGANSPKEGPQPNSVSRDAFIERISSFSVERNQLATSASDANQQLHELWENLQFLTIETYAQVKNSDEQVAKRMKVNAETDIVMILLSDQSTWNKPGKNRLEGADIYWGLGLGYGGMVNADFYTFWNGKTTERWPFDTVVRRG